MKKFLFCMTAALSIAASPVAHAVDPTQSLGSCLTDSLNGKERKELAKWVFMSMAAHPELSRFSTASPEDVKSENQYVGRLISRLLTKDCPEELKLANRANPMALQQAFGLVGQVAMQELMTNPKVTDALTGYTKYTDTNKINAILAGD